MYLVRTLTCAEISAVLVGYGQIAG